MNILDTIQGRKGNTGAIAPVDFRKEAQITPIDQESMNLVIAPID